MTTLWLMIVLILTCTGIYSTLCLVLGVARVLDRRSVGRLRGPDWPVSGQVPSATSVAALIPAHNEELVIERTIASAQSQVGLANIYVISDGSNDTTVQKALAAGANVVELTPNRGKGGAIAAGLEHFGLYERYEYVLFLDADTILSSDYLRTGLPLFSDPSVAAVSGTPRTIWHPRALSPVGQLLHAYRERIYCWVSVALKYGQAWHRANTVVVVPGFASMYRTTALRQIDTAAPGHVIEDINMTFEIHRQRLGKIAFHPRAAIAYTQDPDTFADYVKQVKRWALALWQAVRRQGFLHGGFFWVSLVILVVDLIPCCVILCLTPILITFDLVTDFSGLTWTPGGPLGWLLTWFGLRLLLIVVILPEFLMATVMAISFGRPRYLVLALGFPFLRVLDAALVLYTLPLAWVTRSTGIWVSPARRAAAVHVSESSDDRDDQTLVGVGHS
jgi:biofilm PGA synthesis N-glycosyltransferase PgaC